MRPRARQARRDALLNARALELCDRAEHPGDEPAGGRAGVDPLAERNKRDAARVPVVEQHHQVAEVPAETIEAPAHDRLHSMVPHIGDELVEGGDRNREPGETSTGTDVDGE